VIRLLFLTAEPWPTFRPDVVALFGRYLPRYGVDADLVTLQADSVAEPVVWTGGRAYLADVRGGRASSYFLKLWHSVRQLAAATSVDYDAVQVRDMPVLAALALIVCRWKRIPFFYWMSYPIPEGQIRLARERGLSAGLLKWLFPLLSGRVGCFLLYRFVIPRANHTFVQSTRMKEDLLFKGIHSNRLTPVPMGVDFEAVDAEQIVATDDVRLRGRRVIVYLGTLERPRRIEVLFEMMRLLRADVPDAVLVLVGDAEDEAHRRRLMNRASALGVGDCVVCTGWLPTQEAWGFLKVAEVGLSPIPRGELLDCSSPTKLPEYLAFGLPVVCNDNPDQAALVAACGGGLCVPYTAEHFAGAVLKLLRLDRETRIEMGSRAREHVHCVRDYATISRALASTYLGILGRPRCETV
jgi:glycosyltransferase involved in cell wall biosynthesis